LLRNENRESHRDSEFPQMSLSGIRVQRYYKKSEYARK
jgi:hypothetical protein